MHGHLDARIRQKCETQSKRILTVIVILGGLSSLMAVLEALLPMSDENIEIQINVYEAKYPKRRLPLHLRIPFIVETESWAYETIFIVETYLLFLIASMLLIAVTTIPILLFYIQGQYENLSKYIEMVGQEHQDLTGNPIEYTNIETNTFRQVERTMKNSKSTKLRLKHIVKRSLQSKKHYEKMYIKQIVKYHQKLNIVYNKLCSMIAPLGFLVVSCGSSIMSLCLYEIIVFGPSFRFIAQLSTISTGLFLLFEMSEISHNYNQLLGNAVINSNWTMCSPSARRDLWMVLRCVQRPNYLKFHGAIEPNRSFFLKIIKISYNFVNCMRLRLSRRPNE
ncbi:hypothetical protein WDU94_013044 [Cyamophila willieti]